MTRAHQRWILPATRTVLLSALLGCASTARTAATPAVTRVATAPATPPPAPTEVLLVPALSDQSFGWFEREDDVRHGIVEGMRFEVRGEQVSLAEEYLESYGFPPARTSRGWVFVDNNGEVLGAETFLGPLRRLGHVVASRRRVPGCANARFALALPDGAIAHTDGASSVERVALPGGQTAMTVAFSDLTHGLAISATGVLFRTSDGARSFHPLDLLAEVATALDCERGVLRVTSSDGELTVRDDGVVEHLPPPSPGHAVATERDEEFELRRRAEPRITAAIIEHFPAARDNPAVVRLGNGTSLLHVGRGYQTVDTATGRARPPADDGSARGDEPVQTSECRLRQWGAAVLRDCYSGQNATSDDGQHFTAAPRMLHRATLSDDGVHAAREGGCDPDASESAAPGTVCVLLDGAQGTRELHAPESVRLAQSRGHRDAFLLLGTGPGDGHSPGALYLLHADSGAFERVRIEVEGGPAGARSARLDAHFASDGAIVVQLTSYASGIEVAAGVAPPGVPIRARPLPRGVTSVGFADAMRGIAVGRGTLRPLWPVFRTLDGGQTWTRFALPIDGDAGALLSAIDLDDGLPHDVLCDRESCLLGGVLLVRGWGPQRAQSPVAIVSGDQRDGSQEALLQPLRVPDYGGSEGTRTTEAWQCGALIPQPTGAGATGRGGGAAERERHQTFRAYAGGVQTTLDLTRGGTGQRYWVEWQSDEGRSHGRTTASGLELTDTALVPLVWAGHGRVAYGTGCDREERCRTVLLRDGGDIRELPDARWLPRTERAAHTLLRWPARDGSVLAFTERPERGPRVATTTEFGNDGRVRWFRREVLPDGAALALGTLEGEAGAFVLVEHGPSRFRPFDGGRTAASRDVAANLPARMGFCEGRPDPRGRTRLEAYDIAPWFRSEGGEVAMGGTATARIVDGVVCLDEARVPVNTLFEGARALLHFTRAEGGATGRSGPRDAHAVRCAAPPQTE